MSVFTLSLLSVPFGLWPQFGGDAANSRLQPMGTPVLAPQVVWGYPGSAGEYYFFAARDVTGDGVTDVVLVGDVTNRVICLRGTDGAWQWETSFAGDLETSAVLEDVTGDGVTDVIIPVDFTSGPDTIYCLRGTDGVVQWKAADANLYVAVWSLPTAVDVDADGTVEVVHSGFPTYSINGVTGAIEWSYSSAGAFRAGPAVADVTGDGVPDVIMSKGLSLRCLRGTNGALQWTAPVSEIFYTASIADVTGDGALDVVVAGDDVVYCFRGTDGAVQWTYTGAAGNNYYSDPALGDVTGDGIADVLIANSGTSLVYCLRGTDGAFQWSVSLGSVFFASPGPIALADIDADGYPEAVVGGNLPALSAVDGDGSLLWQLSNYGGSPGFADANDDGCLEILAQIYPPDSAVVIGDTSCSPVYVGVGASPAVRPALSIVVRGSGLVVKLLLRERADCRLALYDASGRLVRPLARGTLTAGEYVFVADALPAGAYVVRLSGEATASELAVVPR